jgi:membrane-associated protease RseP (regulator of RpoE activity)
MAKRVGANSRKKRATLRRKRKNTIRKLMVKALVFAMIVGLGYAGIYFGHERIISLKKKFEDSALLSVKDIVVRGTKNVPEDKVLALSGLKAGMKIFRIDGKKIDTLVSRNPWVERVKLVRNLSGIVSLEISERKPIALVNLGNIYQIDIHGMVLPLTSGINSSLPLVSGLKDTVDYLGRQVIKAAHLKRLISFYQQVREADGNMMSRISQVDLSDADKVRITFQSSPTLYELETESLALRLNHLKRLQEVIVDMAQLPARINLCYQNLAFITQPVSVKTEAIQAVTD